MKDILFCLKQFPLDFNFGIRHLSTHVGAKLLPVVDGFLMRFSDITFDVHEEILLTFLK